MRNKKYVWAIVVIIAGLLIASTVSINATHSDENTNLIKKINTKVNTFNNQMTKVVEIEKMSENGASTIDGSVIIYDTEYDDFHPCIAGDISGGFFAGFELTMDDMDYYPDFWFSLDGGDAWNEAGYFPDSLGSQYPDTDSNNNGCYATFGSPIDSPGQT